MTKTIILLLLNLSILNTFALADDKIIDSPILTVSDSAEIAIPATIATVKLAIEITEKTAVLAQKQTAKKTNAVIDTLKNNGVKTIQSTQITVAPEYRFDNNKNTLIGYRATQGLSFETNVAEAGKHADSALENGATRIDSVTLSADEVAKLNAETSAIKKATKNAMDKAKAALESLQLKMQRIAFINIIPSNNPHPAPRLRAMSANASPQTPVEGGTDAVTATVELGILYR